MIPSRMPYLKKRATVLGRTMAYVESGKGDPIVFVHGNPTSSYLWRNVIPHVEGLGRCIAPDLLGHGDSDRFDGSPERYRLPEQRRYFEAFLEVIGADRNVVLVLHDWGSAVGFDWANRHRDRVRGIAYMEAFVRPLTWSEWPEGSHGAFAGMRSPRGESLVLERNFFIESVLPASILRTLDDETMEAYRAPTREPGENRRAMLSWPRQIPFDGEPADVHAIMADYAAWLGESPVPKLFVNADPGFLIDGARRDFCRAFPNQREVTVRGSHFIQEDSPHEIGQAIAEFVRELSSTRRNT